MSNRETIALALINGARVYNGLNPLTLERLKRIRSWPPKDLCLAQADAILVILPQLGMQTEQDDSDRDWPEPISKLIAYRDIGGLSERGVKIIDNALEYFRAQLHQSQLPVGDVDENFEAPGGTP